MFILLFISKLKMKGEYTGIEQYIFDQIKDGDINWFPMSRAMSLDSPSSGEDDLSVQVKLLNKKFDELLLNTREIMKRQLEHRTTAENNTQSRRHSIILEEKH